MGAGGRPKTDRHTRRVRSSCLL